MNRMTETTVRTRYGPRPELGELKPGQPVIVYRSSNDARRSKPEDRTIPAVIVKASRVWIELETKRYEGWSTNSWRMRRDTQAEASKFSGQNARFVTQDQHDWEETRRWALGYLRENGIDLRNDSRWRNREVELADIISHGTDRTDPL